MVRRGGLAAASQALAAVEARGFAEVTDFVANLGYQSPMVFVLNMLVSAAVITIAAWFSKRFPEAAGFMVALPISTMLVLPLAFLQHRDPESAFTLARSILVALPITLLFFVPFLMKDRFSFWSAYAVGTALLPAGYFVHRAVLRLLAA